MSANEVQKVENTVKVRSEEVRVKMHSDMKKRVDRIATLHGTPTATWCHQVIAAAVVAFERNYQIQNKTQDAIVDGIKEMMAAQLQEISKSITQCEAAGQESAAAAPTSAAGEGAKG